ncbi:MAG: DUF2075 domain-containing protein, partial [Deltaproteobacteria bacterium]|nr:DUF2075 domain-containing protein [Deltaproteobacteria bacterium]
MAIRVITGVPGSGKTYLAVHHLLENYFKWSKDRQEYIKKPNFEDLTIITNIDGFMLDHINLNDALKKANVNIETFFTKDYQEKITEKYNKIIYIIDEAQQYFHRRFYNKDVFYYFEYHRHLGHDIYIVTQDRLLIPKDLYLLAELELRAVKRSLSLGGELKYKKLSNNEIMGHKV